MLCVLCLVLCCSVVLPVGCVLFAVFVVIVCVFDFVCCMVFVGLCGVRG